MALTKQIQTNPDFIDIMNNAIKLFSENTDKSTEELWCIVSEKPYEELKKSTRKKNKRAKTGYRMFSSDKTVRDNIKNESSEELTLGQMSKLVSEKWKSLSDEEKKVYEQMAHEKNEQNPVIKSTQKKTKKKTSYNLYLADKEVREKHKNSSKEKLSMMEINKLMIAEWKTMSDKDKQKYVDLANKLNSEEVKEKVKEEVEEKVEEEVDEEVKEQVDEEVKEEVKEVKKPVKKKKVVKK